MWRISLIVIILCAFAGAGFWNAKNKVSRPPSQSHLQGLQIGNLGTDAGQAYTKVTVVVARGSIKKGELFDGFNLELQEVDLSKVGQSDVPSSVVLLRRHAKRDIPSGMRITYEDINDPDKYLWTPMERMMFAERPAKPGFRWAVFPIANVIPGEQVSPLRMDMQLVDEKKVPPDAIRCGTEVIDRVAPNGISQGEIITEHHLTPMPAKRP